MPRVFTILCCLGAIIPGVSQMSGGIGKSYSVPNSSHSMYVPEHFELQEKPPGCVHKASGTFVVIVKVPEDQPITMEEGLSRSFFEDPGYEIISISEEETSKIKHKGRLYRMKYKIDDLDFERLTLLLKHRKGYYLVIGNYASFYKDQVAKEVDKMMSSVALN